MPELHFPSGGLDKKYSFRQQRPYTSPDCINVRPTETLEGRERGGSRPGLSKAYRTQLGGGSPIMMMNSVTAVRDDGFRTWIDDTSGDDVNDQWEAATFITDEPGIFPIDISTLEYEPTEAALIHKAISNHDTTQPYTISIYILPWEGEHHGAYRIYARMNDTLPVPTTDGIVAELVLSGSTGTYSATIKRYKNSALVGSTTVGETTIGDGDGGWFSMMIDGDNVTLTWRDHVLLDAEDVGGDLGANADHRWGFGMEVDADDDGGIILVDLIQFTYYQTPIVEEYRKSLVALSNGRLYLENDIDMTFSETDAANPDIATGIPIQSAEYQQKLYIADRSTKPVAEGTSSALNAAGTTLTDTEITSAQAAAIESDKNALVVVVENGQGGADGKEGNYAISAAAEGSITLSSSATDGVSAGTCNFRVEKAPKIYDPVTDSLTIWTTTAGILPTGCSLICRYRDCLMLAGDRLNPHLWYLSRVGDPLDFDYGADPDDPAKAVAGSNSEASAMGEPITCLAPHLDDYCIMGGTDSLHVMRGHPAYSGSIDRLSSIAGVISGTSWAYGPGGEILFLSKDGLYVMPGGVDAIPVEFSRERLPRELLNVDPKQKVVTMSYDVFGKGFHLYLTPIDSAGNSYQKHWWIDWSLKSFWPVHLQSDHEPFSTFRYTTNRLSESRVLLGGRDGYIRSYRSTNNKDDGSSIGSLVTIGPIPLGRTLEEEGQIDFLSAILDNRSGDVTWSLYFGDSPEKTLYSDAMATGTFQKGSNPLVRPKLSGQSFSLKLSSMDRWAIDALSAGWHRTGLKR